MKKRHISKSTISKILRSRMNPGRRTIRNVRQVNFRSHIFVASLTTKIRQLSNETFLMHRYHSEHQAEATLLYEPLLCSEMHRISRIGIENTIDRNDFKSNQLYKNAKTREKKRARTSKIWKN